MLLNPGIASFPLSGQHVAVRLDGSVAMQVAARILVPLSDWCQVTVWDDPAQLWDAAAGGPDRRPDVVVLNPDGGDWPFDKVNALAYCAALDCATLRTLVRAGLRGYVCSESTGVALIDAVRTVAGGGFYLPGPVAAALFSDTLSPRELDVLRSLAIGRTHKEIARELGLSKTTVDTYVRRIRQKLGVGNKAELASAAHRLGLLS